MTSLRSGWSDAAADENYFPEGHCFRIEVTSRNFPRFDRNMNTGGNKYDEPKGMILKTAIDHQCRRQLIDPSWFSTAAQFTQRVTTAIAANTCG